jgi:hypothetical protein
MAILKTLNRQSMGDNHFFLILPSIRSLGKLNVVREKGVGVYTIPLFLTQPQIPSHYNHRLGLSGKENRKMNLN